MRSCTQFQLIILPSDIVLLFFKWYNWGINNYKEGFSLNESMIILLYHLLHSHMWINSVYALSLVPCVIYFLILGLSLHHRDQNLQHDTGIEAEEDKVFINKDWFRKLSRWWNGIINVQKLIEPSVGDLLLV